jgi:hypothetical protein
MIVRYLLERLTALDLNLMQRFQRRDLARVAEGFAMRRALGVRGSGLGDSLDPGRIRGRCLRGLEVVWASGWQVDVTAGAMLIDWTAGSNATRPGSWTGTYEDDDYPRCVGILPLGATVSPASPPGGALPGYEYWLVYATASEATVETDTARRVFNEGTGVYDVASAAKVKQQQLTITVLRSSVDSPPNFAGVPSNGIVLALLYVPSGATNLADAVFFDCRKLPELAPGPNRIGGCWQFSHEGQLSGTYNQTIFLGRAWARLGNELLGVRAYSSAIQVGDLAEPGATWDATASPSTPKIAWLYLCKPGGYVPRPVRRGAYPLGHHPTLQADGVQVDGALVLSPTPPRIGAGVNAAEAARSGLRWDLRPSANLTLPGWARGDLAYRYQNLSVTPDDAICIGLYRYTDVDGVPLLVGSQHVDQDGWVRGSAIFSGTTDPSGLMTLPSMTANNSASPRTYTSGTYGFAQLTVGGIDVPLPLDAARLLIQVGASGSGYDVAGSREDAGRIWPLQDGNLAFVDLERRQVTPGRPNLNQIVLTLSTNTFVSDLVTLQAVKLPFGEDLVT